LRRKNIRNVCIVLVGIDAGDQGWLAGLLADWVEGAVQRLFFPPRLGEAAMLQERVGHHRHQGVSVKACPGSSLKVVQAQFFLELLMGLLTDPPGLMAPATSLTEVSPGRFER
jgi:hypothetical protein